jgi:hypothetical protein
VLTYYVIGFDPSFERWEFVFISLLHTLYA